MASYLVRVYAWRTLLGETGIVNSALIAAGITDRPIEFLLFSRVSVVIAEVSLLMPFAALAFFPALSGIGPEFREAASDLGAGPVQTLGRITVPMTGAAVLATTAIVFFASAGDYITPVLVGGPDSATFGTLIASNFGLEGQYGLGAAASFVIFLAFAVVYLGLRSSLRITKLCPSRHNDPEAKASDSLARLDGRRAARLPVRAARRREHLRVRLRTKSQLALRAGCRRVGSRNSSPTLSSSPP